MRFFVLAVLVALTGCRTMRGDSGDGLGEGLASFYGKELNGRVTASGEAFDKDAFTAAHRTLPFGACVLVTVIKSGETVEVRVNDRGPFVAGRIIDVSEAAARKLGFIESGVARVLLRRCD